jgi:phage major head subunit gpT-like protein
MCNLYIMGHNHVKIGTTTEGIDFRKNSRSGAWEMCGVVQGFVRSASFLKGYVAGETVDADSGSYVEEKCLNPAGLGVVTANLRWNIEKDKNGGGSRYTGFKLHVQE